jgi:hypothetical protein
MNKKHLIIFTLAGACVFNPGFLLAQQDQNQDVVEAARKAQAAKKAAPPPKMVFDNDNLSSLKGGISVVGPQPATSEDKAATPADKNAEGTKDATSGKGTTKDEAYWRQQFTTAYNRLNGDTRELDIMQREFNLKQQQFYTDPMAALKQEYSRQDLNDARQKIDDKTAAIAQDKQNISDLEDALRAAGGDPGWATPPSAPPPEEPPAPAPPTQ